MVVTGYQEANEVFRNADAFSACVAIGGPFPPLPFVPVGDDISAQIDEHRHRFPIFEHMVTMDPPQHTRTRTLTNRRSSYADCASCISPSPRWTGDARLPCPDFR